MNKKGVSEYVWSLDQDEKENYISEAKFLYAKDKHFYDDLPVNLSTVKAHENGRLQNMGLNTAYELCRIHNDSLLMPINEEERKQFEGKIENIAGTKRRHLDKDFQKMIFAPYRNKRNYITEKTETTKKSIERYSNYQRDTIPEEVYQDVLEDLKHQIDNFSQPIGDIKVSQQRLNPTCNLETPENKTVYSSAEPKDLIKFKHSLELGKNIEHCLKSEKGNSDEVKQMIQNIKNGEVILRPDTNSVNSIIEKLEEYEIVQEFSDMRREYCVQRKTPATVGFLEGLKNSEEDALAGI